MNTKNTQVAFQIHSLDSVSDVFSTSLQQLLQPHSKIVLSRQTQIDLKTAFYEAVVNAEKHGGELTKRRVIQGALFLNHKWIGFHVKDHGRGFALHKVKVPNLADMSASGRGIFIMKQVSDELKYHKGKRQNTLTFKRFLVGQNASTREIDLLYNISEAVIRGESLYSVCQMILDEALQIFRVERASLLIYDESIKRLKVIASRGMSQDVSDHISVRTGEGVSGYVFQHGRPLLIEDINTNARGIEKKKGYKSGSFISAPMICSPLRLDEKPVGVINLTDRIDGKKFTKKDLKILSTLANQAMACLSIRDLMSTVKKSEALRQELNVVRKIQNSYLPKTAPQISGFDVAGQCEMAQSVGGDYFDYSVVHRWLYLVIADVSGHDIKSAMTMFNFRSQLRVLLSQHGEPENILTHLNFTMHEDLVSTGHFVSALVMRIDIDSGEYTLASAGHYPPLFFDSPYQNMPSGLVLGIEKRETYPVVTGQILPGQGFILFTDGVTEARDKGNRFFGMDRLLKMRSELSTLTSEKMVQRIINDVLQFRDSTTSLDDITVVALKR